MNTSPKARENASPKARENAQDLIMSYISNDKDRKITLSNNKKANYQWIYDNLIGYMGDFDLTRILNQDYILLPEREEVMEKIKKIVADKLNTRGL